MEGISNALYFFSVNPKDYLVNTSLKFYIDGIITYEVIMGALQGI